MITGTPNPNALRHDIDPREAVASRALSRNITESMAPDEIGQPSPLAQALYADHFRKGFMRSGSDHEYERIRKSLTAGFDLSPVASGPPANPTGQAMKIEALTASFYSALIGQVNLSLINSLRHVPVFSNIVQVNEQTSRGTPLNGAYISETGLPPERTLVNARRPVTLTIRAVGGSVGLAAALVATAPGYGDATSRMMANNSDLLAVEVERQAFYDSAALVPGLSGDGIYQQILQNAPQNVLRVGQALTLPVLDGLMTDVIRNYSMASMLYASPAIMGQFTDIFSGAGRYDLDKASNSVGRSITSILLPCGAQLALERCFVLGASGTPDSAGDFGHCPSAAQGDASLRPGNPVAGAAPALVVVASPLWVAGSGDHDTEPTGTGGTSAQYSYWVVAYNEYGHSDPVSLGAAVNHDQPGTNAIQVNWTPAAGPAPLFYRIFRARRGVTTAANAYEIAALPQGTVMFQDQNARLPGTYDAFLLSNDGDDVFYAHLGPEQIKIPLGQVNAATRWAQAHIGNVVVGNPRKCSVLTAIERPTGFFGRR